MTKEDLIISKIDDLAERVSELPTNDSVRLAVLEGIRDHEKECRKKNRKLPTWAKATVAIITAASGAGVAWLTVLQ